MRVQKVHECDATDDAICTLAGLIKIPKNQKNPKSLNQKFNLNPLPLPPQKFF